MNQIKILLTGEPRSGKSTLIKKIILPFSEKQGFITEEVLTENERIGFDMVTASAKRTPLARTDLQTEHRVSKYFVELRRFESLLPELDLYS